MWRQRGFPACILIALLVSSVAQIFIPCEFSVSSASASPDSYSDSLQYVRFTVEGATFVHRENYSSTNIGLWFVTPSEGDIKITASCEAREGDGYITLSLASPLALARDLDEARGRDVGLSVSGSLGINESAYLVDIRFGYGSEWGNIITLQFMAQPVITWFKVNATTVPLHDEVKIYGEVKPKDLAYQVFLNYTHEGEFYNTYQASVGSDPGSFYDTFFAFSNVYGTSLGEWTVTAEVWSDRGGMVPDDLITDTASVSFTVTNGTQSSTPPPTESPTVSPTPSSQPHPDLDFLSVIFDFFVDTLGIPEFLVVPLLIILGFSVVVVLALLVHWAKHHS